MSLTKPEITRLLELVSQTKGHELNCEECLAHVAAFAESQLSGRSLSTDLQMVEQHLAVCDECREEYEALRLTLDSLDGDDYV